MGWFGCQAAATTAVQWHGGLGAEPPESQGVWGAQPPRIQWVRGAKPPGIQGVRGAKPPGMWGAAVPVPKTLVRIRTLSTAAKGSDSNLTVYPTNAK